jgi:hypothetical protein
VGSGLAALSEAQLSQKIYIRSEAHSVTQAINRQIAHYAYHVGQIVYVAKHFAGAHWTSLTVPKGKSEEFTSRVASGKASQR